MSQNRSMHQDHEEEELPGAFTGSLIVGLIILAIWVSVFLLYIGRL